MKVSKFQFVNPYLEELEFNANPEFNLQEDGGEIKNTFDVHIKKSANENIAKVILTLKVNQEEENAPFRLKVSVASDFRWEDLSEQMLDAMLNNNAPALLLGYMRPIVAGITNASIFPAYNLPFINFNE